MRSTVSSICFDAGNASDDILSLLIHLKRNLSDLNTRTKTQEHPIVRQFVEVMKLIYLGEK